MCVGRLVKVCVIQEHLEWRSVESSPDNHQLLVIPSFGSLCSWAGGPGSWRGAGALVLCSQLCLSCSTNCVIEKLFHFFFPSFHKHCAFCSAASKARSWEEQWLSAGAAGEQWPYLAQGRKRALGRTERAPSLTTQLASSVNLSSEIYTLAWSLRETLQGFCGRLS